MVYIVACGIERWQVCMICTVTLVVQLMFSSRNNRAFFFENTRESCVSLHCIKKDGRKFLILSYCSILLYKDAATAQCKKKGSFSNFHYPL